MLRIMSKFFGEFELGSFSMSQAIGCAGRGSNKVAKEGVKGFVVESNEDIGAEAGSRASLGIVLKQDGWSVGLKRKELMHPCRRFGKFISQNVRDLGARIFADTLASSASETVANSIVQKIKCIEVDARCGMESKRVPRLLASAHRRWKKG